MTAENISPETPEDQKNQEKEHNFAQLRQKFESASYESEEQKRKNRELQEEIERLKAQVSTISQSPKQEEDDDDDDFYVEKKKFEKKIHQLKEELKKEFSKQAESKTHEALAQERQNNFIQSNKDFYETLSHENIQKFADKYPDLAQELSELPDNFHRQKLLYRQMKHFNIAEKDKENDIQSKIDANKRNPLGMSNSGMAPYAGAGDFSSAGQKSAYEKMQELKKRMRIG